MLRRQTDDEVEHPVGTSNNGNTPGPLAIREDLLGQDPCDRAYRQLVRKVEGIMN